MKSATIASDAHSDKVVGDWLVEISQGAVALKDCPLSKFRTRRWRNIRWDTKLNTFD